jgi:biopolymer transport protein ExbB/TolQ
MDITIWVFIAEATMAFFAAAGFNYQLRQNHNLKRDAKAKEVNRAEHETNTLSGEYLRRSLDAFDELVGSLQSEVSRMTTERNEARKLAENMEHKLTIEIDALRREVRALRQVLIRHGIPFPADVDVEQ